MAVGLSAAEISLLIVAVGLIDAGPLGVVIDVGVIVPVELLLVDIEISYARYLVKVFTTGTKEGIDLELTIYPALIDFFKEP